MLLHATMTEYEDTIIGQIVEIDGIVVEGKNEEEVIKQLKLGVEGYFKAFPVEKQNVKPEKVKANYTKFPLEVAC